MSPWFQIVASNIAVAIAIGGLAAVVGRGGRRAPLAHALWILVLVKLVTPPLIPVAVGVPAQWLPDRWLAAAPPATAAPSPRAQATAAIPNSSSSELPRPLGATGTGAGPAPVADMPVRQLHLWDWLAAVWAAGAICVVARGLLRFVRFHRLLLQEAERDSAATEFVRQLLQRVRGRSRLGLVRSVSPDVLRIPARVSPMLFGFGRRAVIVCPDRLWLSLSEGERHAFLAHETAHFFRRDHWVRWLEWLVTAVYWWFPGVYIARRELERHEEAACDAWAVQKLGANPRQYAEALLRVVDYLSEHPVGLPRLANGMQPTDSLEQRLRLLMRPGSVAPSWHPLPWAASAACVTFWMLHPSLQPRMPMPVASAVSAASSPSSAATTHSRADVVAGGPAALEVSLPEPPRGFWNQHPDRRWAHISLRLPGASLIAEASRGIAIERPGGEPLRFSPRDLSAIVEIPSTRRVVIGDEEGRVRLWDLQAGLPTSLIGRHGAAVTSVAYREGFGIVSGDAAGSVMRWDLQSGQVLATWSAPTAPVQAVRASAEGRKLAVLLGSWNTSAATQEVHFVDALSLQSEGSARVSSSTAVVLPAPAGQWFAVEWSGVVRLLSSGVPIATIDKQVVSALVISQDAECSWPGMLRQSGLASGPAEEAQ